MARVAGVEVSLDHYIGGERVASDDRFEDVSPIDEHVLGEVARGGRDEARLAVDAATAAFEKWGETPPADRAAVLHRIADGVEARIPALSAVETEDNGALLRSHLRGVMPRVAHNFRFFADRLLQLRHDDFETRGHRNHVTWDPAGVAVLVTPWNAPLMLATWKVAPALAAGDTVVLKPAEWSPLTASLLADIAAEAGLPPGVLNVVQGIGEEVGDALVSDPRVARISFTGSGSTARAIAARAAANLVPVSFELGGKSPLVVLGDADMDLAVRLAIEQYDNAGQVCLAGTRLLVDSAIAEEFTERLLSGIASLRQGDPRLFDTDIGPQITRAHFERIDGFVRRAVSDGAEVLSGGGPNSALGGLYYLPTLIGGAKEGSEILTEEVFGPVLTIQTFDSDDEAVAMANSTRFGLAATIVSSDDSRAGRVAARVVAGTVWVNCFYVRDLRAPFGGSRESGIGREGGNWSFDFYCDVKDTVFAPSASKGGEGL
ncbi:MAG: aldehyde dehydrogenase [Actinomycetota bacterium]|nr:aldehyde dehydrogenase [Actinomycetota bacterium]